MRSFWHGLLNVFSDHVYFKLCFQINTYACTQRNGMDLDVGTHIGIGIKIEIQIQRWTAKWDINDPYKGKNDLRRVEICPNVVL